MSVFERSFHGNKPETWSQVFFGKRALNIFNQAFYPVVGMLCQTLQQLINTLLIGRHLESRNLLAALGLGTLTISLVIFSVVYTFNNALLTLVSQAFGQKDMKLCATYLNR